MKFHRFLLGFDFCDTSKEISTFWPLHLVPSEMHSGHGGTFVICHWSRLVLTIWFQMRVQKSHFNKMSLVFVMYYGFRILMQMVFQNETPNEGSRVAEVVLFLEPAFQFLTFRNPSSTLFVDPRPPK